MSNEVTLEKKEEVISLLTHKQLILRKFRRHKLAMISIFCLAFLYILCIFSDFFVPYSTITRFGEYASMPPMKIRLVDINNGSFIGPFVYGIKSERNMNTFMLEYVEDTEKIIPLRFFHAGEEYRLFGFIRSNIHLFGVDEGMISLMGTDPIGRDLFSRIIHGGRLSLSIGLIGVFFSMILGLTLGGIAGFYGGKVDTVIMRTLDLFMSLHTIPLWMGLAAAVPRDWSVVRTYLMITIILSFFGWTNIARVVRGRFLSVREEDFVLAAKLAGAKDSYIIINHMIPSFMNYIIVSLTLSIPGMIIGETTLSFLGLGLQPPAVSWGVLLQDSQNFRTIFTMPWLLLPGAFVVFAVLAFNFIGDGLRDASDPYS